MKEKPERFDSAEGSKEEVISIIYIELNLWPHFSKFGQIVDIKIFSERHYAFMSDTMHSSGKYPYIYNDFSFI